MKILDFIDRVAVSTAIVAIVAMTLLVTTSVIGRYLFSLPIPGDLVLSEFLMVFVVFLPRASKRNPRAIDSFTSPVEIPSLSFDVD